MKRVTNSTEVGVHGVRSDCSVSPAFTVVCNTQKSVWAAAIKLIISCGVYAFRDLQEVTCPYQSGIVCWLYVCYCLYELLSFYLKHRMFECNVTMESQFIIGFAIECCSC